MYLIIVSLISLFYKGVTIAYYYYLRRKLKNATLDNFKAILGTKYQYRLIHTKATRYKWYKGWVIIRATFDDTGKLVSEDKPEFNLIKPISEFNLSSSINS